ncbi:IS110 family transposase [Methylocaldum sp.]|uniref:IS110 family transposase n=1 Tax=Methylocaldum sp. TaxID=1969727 RepID=UPI002D74C581|nr:IS110 family transposase [Methylocaldum sp.]HYE35267.1 IS110 family transposase [Methylocaldum sp.]
MSIANSFAVLGLDVSKAKLDGALRLPNGKYKTKTIPNTPAGFQELQTWLGKQSIAPVRVCLEATGIYWEAVAECLADTGFPVAVVNPAQIKAHRVALGTRTKTDAVDARLIADFGYRHEFVPWQPPPQAERELRARVLRLDALQRMRIQEGNRLAVAPAMVRASLEAHLAWLDAEIEALIRAIRHRIKADPDLRQKARLLDAISGLGERTIAVLLAFSVTPDRFQCARQVAGYAGLNPRRHDSGSLQRPARLSKVSHAFLRKALYMPALVALYKTAWGKVFGARLASAGKPPMVIIGAMMRKLLQMAFGVLRSAQPFNPALHGA